MLTDVVELWSDLQRESTDSSRYLERLIRPDSHVQFILGFGNDRATIKICANYPPDWEKSIQTPSCLSCDVKIDEPLSIATFRYNNNAPIDIFIWFSQDLANRLEDADSHSAPEIIGDSLEEWAEAFKVDVERGMSRQAQQGLFAELFYMDQVLVNDFGPKALLGWHSQNAVHDFQIDGTAWEVKSYAGRRMEVHISSEAQLDTVGLRGLTLAVVGLKISEESGMCINEIVEAFLERYAEDQTLVSLFRTGLAKYGYIDDSSIVHTYYFNPRHISEYSITGDFPRIIASDIPSSIFNVKYTLSLSSLEEFLTKPMIEY